MSTKRTLMSLGCGDSSMVALHLEKATYGAHCCCSTVGAQVATIGAQGATRVALAACARCICAHVTNVGSDE